MRGQASCPRHRQNRRLTDERFVLFWKDDIDDEWRVMGADVTSPPTGDFMNLKGEPVADVPEIEFSTAQGHAVRYILTTHKEGSKYYFTKSGDDTQFALTPGQTIKHNLDPGVAGGTFITIEWNTDIDDLDIVEIWSVKVEEEATQ